MTPRVRAAFATLRSAPWRRAPLLLRRHPGTLASVAGSTVLVCAAAAVVPLFLSSAGTEANAVQADERCARDTGATYSPGFTAAELRDPPVDPFSTVNAHVGPAVSWTSLRVTVVDPGGSGRRALPLPLLHRDGFLDHVEVVAGSPGPGLWLSDRALRGFGLGPGDTATVDEVLVESIVSGLRLERTVGGSAEVPVAGVYRDLAGQVAGDDYWCGHADVLSPTAPGEAPPPVLLADGATLAALMDDFRLDRVPGGWDAPLRAPGELTQADAARLIQTLGCATEASTAFGWCAGVDVADDHSITREVAPAASPTSPIDDSAGRSADAQRFTDAGAFVSAVLVTHLPFVVDRTRAIQASVAGGVAPVAGFAGLAGVALVAATASLWFDRRRREVRLLTVRGVSPAGLGLKAVLELLFALAAGAVTGLVVAYGLVVWLGPSPVIEPRALGHAAVGCAGALIVSALTIGTVVATRARGDGRRPRRWRRLSLVPWEVPIAVTALVSYFRLGEWGVPVARGAEVSDVDVLGLLFPLVFVLGGVTVAMRVLGLGLPALHRASEGWPTSLYIAVRRVARFRVAVLGLVAVSAVAAGVVSYAATLDRSLAATLHAKAEAFVGSDVAVSLPPDQVLPADLAATATTVTTYRFGWIDHGDRPGGDSRTGMVTLAIDPETFGRAAFWDPSFSDVPLSELLDRLSATGDGHVPALVVGADVPRITDAAITGGPTSRFIVEQVAEVTAFPGMKRHTPTMIVAASSLEGLPSHGTTTEAWISGDHDEVMDALSAAGLDADETRRFAEVADRASFLAVSWTFGFMQSIGVSAGALTLGGVAVYLDARRRGRVLGYAFARRMGLGRRAHARALMAELAAGVIVGCWLGLGISLVAAWLAFGQIDPVPDLRPGPLLRPAVVPITTMAVGAVALTGVAAVWAQRRADRDDPVEVLRAGT